ncbi:MAG: ABC transporter permease [Myxococcaceae bacterium]|nr:ABC transporter permease [Myxococcaceae bacterium]
MAAGSTANFTVGWGVLLQSWFSAQWVLRFHDFRSAMAAVEHEGVRGVARGIPHVWGGLAVWFAGWAVIAAGIRRKPDEAEGPSAAVGAPLYPPLARFQDFHWGTLGAYCGGIFAAQLVLVFGYLASVKMLPQIGAFLLCLSAGGLIAFAGGFFGAANSKRLSTPEATIAVLYAGLPIPIFLTLLHQQPAMALLSIFDERELLAVRSLFHEVMFLSSLLGDNMPALGYWLVYGFLVLVLVLGINLGFVATSSGRVDLRLSYELFVASRHVSVFRPRLIGGVLITLLFIVVPPLLLYAIATAANAAVEMTRIQKLGLKDPLKAAAALNLLKAKRQGPTAMMTALSVGGVGVGVMALIIVLSVMSGFELDLQQKILGTNAHGVVMKYAGEAMPEYPEVMKKIGGVKGIVGQTPFILNEVMVATEGNIAGSMIKGIDPKTVGSVTDLPRYMQTGSLEGLTDPSKIVAPRLAPLNEPALDDAPTEKKKPELLRDPLIEEAPHDAPDSAKLPGLVLGKEMANSLRVTVGDRVNVVSPLGSELGPQGPMPKSRPFRVAGIFYSGMFEYDSKFVYISIDEAQSFFGLKGVNGVEVKVDDIDDTRRIMKAVRDVLDGYPYRTKDWGEMNANLFAALRLEKLVMGIILSIIIVVAAGLIVATVIMLVLEKRKEIAVLKALGVSDGGIVKIFLTEGLQIGIVGSVLGLISGLVWCLFIEKYGIKLDPQVYYIPALPVRIEPFQTALSVVIAVLISFLASIYPALKASQVEPVEGLKAE